MIRWLCLFAFLMTSVSVLSQEALSELPKKGSYLYYGQPAFEDNSFLLEEAINQEKGVMQYISNLYFDNIRGGNFQYSFTQEIPISHLRHQLNYTLVYNVLGPKVTTDDRTGFGDMTVGYHYMISGKKAWAMAVSSLNVIIPTGNAINGHGEGGWGGQLNISVTKRLSHKIITHYNAGYTFISQADKYNSTITGGPILSFEKDLQYKNLGASVVWYPSRKLNWFMEYISNFRSDINVDGTLSNYHQQTINPGLRFAIDHNFIQIVPGLSVPVILVDGKFDKTGLFFYLSIEHQYLPFTKEKAR